MTEAELRAEGRREAAPAALAALLVRIALALVSWARQWELLGLPWWIWLLVGIPAFLLTIDLSLTLRGKGLSARGGRPLCFSAFSCSETSLRSRFSLPAS